MRFGIVAAAVAAAILVRPGVCPGAVGAPDCAGYTWADAGGGCNAAAGAFGPGATTLPGRRTMAGPVPLGFSMPWQGRTVSQVWLSPHGYVTFSDQGPTTGLTQRLPGPSAPNDLFAAYWIPATGADITWEAGPGIFHVGWSQPRPSAPSLESRFELLLHADGRVHVVWEAVHDVSLATVGYEDAAGTCGRTLYRNGLREGGVFPVPGNGAACVFPPSLLDCTGATPLACGGSVRTRLPSASGAGATDYSCTGTPYPGNELVYRLDVAAPSAVTVNLSGGTVDLLHVSGAPCAETACLGLGPNRFDFPLLAAGSHWFVVDKDSTGNSGNFTISADCRSPYRTVSCEELVAGDTTGVTGTLARHACAPGLFEGPEALYRLTLPSRDSLAAVLTPPPPGAWVFVYAASAFESGGSCLAGGPGGAGVFDAPAGDYVIVVDAEAGASGPHLLEIACGPDLDCTGAPTITCGELVRGDTRGSSRSIAIYDCVPEALDGAEVVYRLYNPAEQTVTARFTASQPGQRLLLLPACDGDTCRLAGDAGLACTPYPPGFYYLIVDGVAGSEGPFELKVECSRVRAGVDLQVTHVDASALRGDCRTLEVSGAAIVAVTNAGAQDATTPFDVMLFEDRVLDGRYVPADDNLLGQATVRSPLASGRSTLMSIPASSTMLFRDNVVHAVVDSGDAVAESDEANNGFDTGRGCEYRPTPGVFTPEPEWTWNASSTLSAFNEVDTVPLVADVDGDQLPDVVFVAGFTQFNVGVVRAIAGDGSREIWTASSADAFVWSSTNPALADLDGDGRPEVVAQSYVASDPDRGRRLVAIDDDGSVLWRSRPFLAHPAFLQGGGAPAIADLDCDGTPEIIFGADVFRADGDYFWVPDPGGTYGTNGGDAPISVAADVDGDGWLEVVAGPTAYKWNPARGAGEVLWRNGTVPDGWPAVGNFDGDDAPEIAVTAQGSVYLLEGDTGALAWRRPLPRGGGGCTVFGLTGGPPTIADFDGDCAAEIGVAGADWYTVFETDGSEKWRFPINDCSSNRTASSVFDFDGDGAAEVVYADEQDLHVLRGTDGDEIASVPTASHTWTEMIAIADVDGDNNAEIVVPLNGCVDCDPDRAAMRGIMVVGDAADNWVNTRRIWNQHAYHIDNVNDDGTVPGPLTGGCERPSWRQHGTYRDQLGTAMFVAPDITLSVLSVATEFHDDCRHWLRALVRVGNGGAVPVGRSFPAWFHDGDPSLPGSRPLGGGVIPDLRPGEYRDVEILVPLLAVGSRDIHAVADDDGAGRSVVSECREDNNRCAFAVDVTDLSPDPPRPVGPALRAPGHGDPNAPLVTGTFDWSLDFGAPRVLGGGFGEDHYHLLRGTDPRVLSLITPEPYLATRHVDATPRAVAVPFVHFYRVVAADGCEQVSEEPMR